MIKAVFLDVDGTLYSHGMHAVPPSALRALEALREGGIRIFLATGRHQMALKKLNLPAFPFDGYVTLTGHLCYDRDWRPVFRSPLPEADQAALVRAFEARRHPLLLLHEHEEYINYVDALTAGMMAAVSSAPPRTAAYNGEPIYAAALYSTREEAERLMTGMPGCRLSAWYETGFDIISREVGKVRGIEEMLRRFDLRREETAVFGDADNDVEMLEYAGVGVAMGNGTPAAKAAADLVTADVDADGLACAFRTLGLLKE